MLYGLVNGAGENGRDVAGHQGSVMMDIYDFTLDRRVRCVDLLVF